MSKQQMTEPTQVVTSAWLDALPSTLQATSATARIRSDQLAGDRVAKLSALNKKLSQVESVPPQSKPSSR